MKRIFILCAAFAVLLCGCDDYAAAPPYAPPSEEISAETESDIYTEPVQELFHEQLTDGRISPYTGREIISHPYGYRFLTERQQYIYDRTVTELMMHGDRIDFAEKITFDEFYEIYQMIYLDEYRLFYLSDSFEYFLDGGYIDHVLPKYTVSKEETEEMREALERKTDEILSGLSPRMNDHEAVMHIHDSIITGCTYSEDAFLGDTVYGCLVEGAGICQAYSKAFAYLCAEAGMTALTVEGSAGDMHMWDIVEMDGEYYHIDPTWDDPDRDDMPVSYDYFGLTDKRISEIRLIFDGKFERPAADGEKYGYYTYCGLVAEDVIGAKELITRELDRAAGAHENVIRIMCADDAVYEETVGELFEENKIFELIGNSDAENIVTDEVVHICDPDTRTIKIILDYTN